MVEILKTFDTLIKILALEIKSEEYSPEIIEASEVLFNKNESFFKNHRVIPPIKETCEENGKTEGKEGDGGDNGIWSWDTGQEPEAIGGEAPGWDNPNEDMKIEDDVNSNKANDDGQGEHITEEENRGKFHYLIYRSRYAV